MVFVFTGYETNDGRIKVEIEAKAVGDETRRAMVMVSPSFPICLESTVWTVGRELREDPRASER